MMLGVFPVTKLSPDASEIIEPVGSKRKFWYADRQLLFKQNRAGTGEDWAEVIAAEVAASLGMPHAYYELAEIAGHGAPVFGVVSRNFCPPDADLVLEPVGVRAVDRDCVVELVPEAAGVSDAAADCVTDAVGESRAEAVAPDEYEVLLDGLIDPDAVHDDDTEAAV